MPTVAEPRREQGFSLVETIVAAVLLGVTVTSVVFVANATTRSNTKVRLADKQVAVLAGVSENVRSDSSWAAEQEIACEDIDQPIRLDGWLRDNLDRELAEDPQTGAEFRVSGFARPVDSPSDGACGSADGDEDGILPDYYDVTITTSLDNATKARFDGIEPIAQRFQMDLAKRMAGGRLTIQACYAWPQVDLRIPTSSCGDSAAIERVPIAPPTGAGTLSDGTNACANDDERYANDCETWRCANPALHGSCPLGMSGRSDYVEVQLRPGAGWTWSLRPRGADDAEAPVASGTLDSTGSAKVTNLKPGDYDVSIEPGSDVPVVPWATHSIPLDGEVTVSSGRAARAIQMFRPARRNDDLRIPVFTVDQTWYGARPPDEYTAPPLPGLVAPLSGPRYVRLVPFPFGRTGRGASTTINTGDTEAVFRNVEPGIYTLSLSTSQTDDTQLHGTWGGHGTKRGIASNAGFLFVPPTDNDPIAVPGTLPDGVTPVTRRIEFGYCRSNEFAFWGVANKWVRFPPGTRPVGIYNHGLGDYWEVSSCSNRVGGGGGPIGPGGGGSGS
jgi:type II secretory pathway pseudopilin PulG